MPLLVEPDGAQVAGSKLAGETVLRPDGAKVTSLHLPCTLLVDSRGRVKGRAFGAPMMAEPRPRLPRRRRPR